MSVQVSRVSAGEYQADELAGVARLSWRVPEKTMDTTDPFVQNGDFFQQRKHKTNPRDLCLSSSRAISNALHTRQSGLPMLSLS